MKAWELIRDLRGLAFREQKALMAAATLNACLDLGSFRCETNEETLALAVKELFGLAARLELRLYEAAKLAPPPVFIVMSQPTPATTSTEPSK